MQLWLVGLAGIALAAAAGVATATSHHADLRGLNATFGTLIGVAFVATGLYAWSRRPDNRVGWMEGETPDTPDVVESHLDSTPPADDIEVRLWDPSAQLRFKRKGHVPSRPDGAPNTAPAAGREGRSIQ